MYGNQIVQRIVRTIYPYGKIRSVFRGTLRGMRFYVAPSMGFTFAAGFDSMNWSFFVGRISTGTVVYDIGANRGQMSMFLSSIVGKEGKVYSFEPVPEMLFEAKRNILLNNINNVDLLPFALAEKNGLAKFLYDSSHSTQGKLEEVETSYVVGSEEYIDVQTRSIDSLIDGGLPVPGFMKIDVEGAGAVLFEGAGRILEQYHPDIYIELHGPDEQKAVSDHLATRGYRFFSMDGKEIYDPLAYWNSSLWCTKKRSLVTNKQ